MAVDTSKRIVERNVSSKINNEVLFQVSCNFLFYSLFIEMQRYIFVVLKISFRLANFRLENWRTTGTAQLTTSKQLNIHTEVI